MALRLFGSKAPNPGWAADGRSDGGADAAQDCLSLASATSQQELVDKVFALFTPDGLLAAELTLCAGGAITGHTSKADAAWAATWAVANATLSFFNAKREASVRFAYAIRDVSGSTSFFGRYLLPGAPSPAWMLVLREAGAATMTPELLACRTFKYSSWRHAMSASFALAPNGFVTGSGRVHADEHSWGVEDGCLALYHADGRRSCLFPLVVSGFGGELVLAGPFCIPDNTVGAWHFLVEVREGAQRDGAAALKAALSGRSFRYENSDRVLGRLTLDPRGFVFGMRNINETCWDVTSDGGELILKHAAGETSCRFPVLSTGEDGLITAFGPFLLSKGVGITHFLREMVGAPAAE